MPRISQPVCSDARAKRIIGVLPIELEDALKHSQAISAPQPALAMHDFAARAKRADQTGSVRFEFGRPIASSRRFRYA